MDKLLKDLEAVALLYAVADYENPQKEDWGRFSEALHNLYRTHHAEIADAVRNKARLEWASHNWGGTRNDYALHVLKVGGTGDLADIRSFIDAAIDAQHNSAREG